MCVCVCVRACVCTHTHTHTHTHIDYTHAHTHTHIHTHTHTHTRSHTYIYIHTHIYIYTAAPQRLPDALVTALTLDDVAPSRAHSREARHFPASQVRKEHGKQMVFDTIEEVRASHPSRDGLAYIRTRARARKHTHTHTHTHRPCERCPLTMQQLSASFSHVTPPSLQEHETSLFPIIFLIPPRAA